MVSIAAVVLDKAPGEDKYPPKILAEEQEMNLSGT
jgi:hypothetical protein